jgi:hypothetical protein
MTEAGGLLWVAVPDPNLPRGAASVTVGAGYGRAWTQDAAGRVTVVTVDDYALIVHLRRKRDCPTGGTIPVVGPSSSEIPVLAAWDRPEPGRSGPG